MHHIIQLDTPGQTNLYDIQVIADWLTHNHTTFIYLLVTLFHNFVLLHLHDRVPTCLCTLEQVFAIHWNHITYLIR